MLLKKRKIKNFSAEKREALEGYLFILPWIIGFMAFSIYPMIHTGLLSFSKVTSLDGFLTESVGWANYQRAFVFDVDFLPMFLSIIQRTGISTVLIMSLSLFIAVLLNIKLKGQGFFRAVFFLPVILGTGFAFQQLMAITMPDGVNRIINVSHNIHLFLGADLTMVLINILNQVVLVFWQSSVQIVLFLSALQSIPESMYEAAHCEGASSWEAFWKITLPMITPMILINTIYTVIDSFTNINNPIMGYIHQMGFLNIQYGYAAALGILYFIFVFLVVMIIYVLLSRKVFYAGDR